MGFSILILLQRILHCLFHDIVHKAIKIQGKTLKLSHEIAIYAYSEDFAALFRLTFRHALRNVPVLPVSVNNYLYT